MCRNHSHITCEITGHLRVGETDMMEVRMLQPLGLDLPYGERWIKPAMTALWMPVSMRVPLPASIRQVMEVCFTPLYYTEASDMMHGFAPKRRPMSAMPDGPTVWSDLDTSQLNTGGASDEDDTVPW